MNEPLFPSTVARIFHDINKCSWEFSMWRAKNMTFEDQMDVINDHPEFRGDV